jgi:hypothetical protein
MASAIISVSGDNCTFASNLESNLEFVSTFSFNCAPCLINATFPVGAGCSQFFVDQGNCIWVTQFSISGGVALLFQIEAQKDYFTQCMKWNVLGLSDPVTADSVLVADGVPTMFQNVLASSISCGIVANQEYLDRSAYKTDGD